MFTCSKCGNRFDKRRGTSLWCPACWKLYDKSYYSKNPKESRLKSRKYYYSHREQCIQAAKDHRDAIRLETFNHYGGLFCACCGEEQLKFLTLDHIEGGGTKHRNSLNGIGGIAFYQWLKLHDWPVGYRVLCYNCNCGSAYNNGVCPHNEEEL